MRIRTTSEDGKNERAIRDSVYRYHHHHHHHHPKVTFYTVFLFTIFGGGQFGVRIVQSVAHRCCNYVICTYVIMSEKGGRMGNIRRLSHAAN